MREVITKVYTFDELDAMTQEKIISEYQSDEYLHDCAIEDGFKSLKAFCDHFGVKIVNYEIAPFNPSYVHTDASNDHFRGLKLKNCDPDYMPTGYFTDEDFFKTFYEQFKKHSDAKQAFLDALEAGLWAIVQDCENCYDSESIIEHIRELEHEFTEDGMRFL